MSSAIFVLYLLILNSAKDFDYFIWGLMPPESTRVLELQTTNLTVCLDKIVGQSYQTQLDAHFSLWSINKVVDCFYIALFSAFKQSHCTLVTCGYEWMTSILCALHSWCHVKLIWKAYVLCTPYSHAPLYSTCHFIRVYVTCEFSCNLPPAPLSERAGSFTCYCSNRGVERIPK